MPTPVPTPTIHRLPVERLKHIEGFSKRRVEWLMGKMLKEGVWTKPVAVDDAHDLVLDGQHRMEAAKRLGLKWVPAIRYSYAEVEVWRVKRSVVLRAAHETSAGSTRGCTSRTT